MTTSQPVTKVIHMDNNSLLGLMFAVPGLAIAVLVGLWYIAMKRRNR